MGQIISICSLVALIGLMLLAKSWATGTVLSACLGWAGLAWAAWVLSASGTENEVGHRDQG